MKQLSINGRGYIDEDVDEELGDKLDNLVSILVRAPVSIKKDDITIF